MTLPRDTSPEAWARYMDAMRTTPPDERVRRALEMSDSLRELARTGIRHRHPEWTPEQVQEGLEEIMLGADMARSVRAARDVPAR
jgi:Rv0078B-related antitoxin